jgi:hypothetical protein
MKPGTKGHMMNRAIDLARPLLLCVAGMALMTPVMEAQTFTYTPRDLILSLRQTSGTGSATDVAINLGPASQYYGGLGSGSPVDLTSYYNPADLQSTYGVSLANVSWSIAGGVATGDGGDPSVPVSTLWVTRGRLDPDVQSVPWQDKSAFSQGGTAARIIGIANGAVSVGTALSSTYATVPDADTQSYHSYVGASLGNYGGTFQGNVENSTGATGGLTRSDLYEMRPAAGNPNATYLGYFELGPSGALTFTAVPEPGTWAMVGLAGLMPFGVQRFRRQG